MRSFATRGSSYAALFDGLWRPSTAIVFAAGASVRYFTNSYAASLCFDGAAMKAPSTVVHGRSGLFPASGTAGNCARPHSIDGSISPRNHGPVKIIAALPWLNSAVINAVDGSAGRMPWSIHETSNSSPFTFSGALSTGFAVPGSKTRPPNAFCNAAW